MCDEVVNVNKGSSTSVSLDSNRGVWISNSGSLEDTLVENILLKRELRLKLDEILHLRSQLLNTYKNPNKATFCIIEEEDLIFDPMVDVSRLIGGGEFTSTSEKNLPISSISESMLEWADQNRSEVIEKLSKASVIAKDLSIGIVGGYGSAWIIKKFGTAAITAIGGGFFLLQIANRRGYVVVNWNAIYNSIIDKDLSEDYSDNRESGGTIESDCFSMKIHQFKKWSKDNTNLIIGFIGGFIYKTYA